MYIKGSKESLNVTGQKKGDIVDPIDIIKYFYPQDTVLRKLLIWHSEQVRDKALQIAKFNKNKKQTYCRQT